MFNTLLLSGGKIKEKDPLLDVVGFYCHLMDTRSSCRSKYSEQSNLLSPN